MNIETLKKIFSNKDSVLHDEEIIAVFLYGSQVAEVAKIGVLPKGKEIDLVFIKKGHLKDGERPFSLNIAKKLFDVDEDIVFTFNGIWGDVRYSSEKYYLDILGEGTLNLKSGAPSSKIFAIKEKLFLWGIVPKGLEKQKLTPKDRQYLKQIMTSYVKREFFPKDSLANRKGIFKNALFIASLGDEKILMAQSRPTIMKLLKSSPSIDVRTKKCLMQMEKEYQNNNHNRLCSLFKRLSKGLEYEKIQEITSKDN